ncbi:MAG: hypothetical protein JW891_15075 [Candidatus Lokiarchaeota archaeon]|nr:hypothetical protein [Candidatus Lokiarchaeota archaeon]
MSPNAVFLYEIDKSFGPNLIAEFNLTKTKISKDFLIELAKKHVEKELTDATVVKDDIKGYSSKIEGESIKKDNLYLGFIMKDEEELISLKSLVEKMESNVIENYSTDKNKLTQVLKQNLTSILGLMERLKEPKLIVETINEKTKKMLDDGKIQEARELIDLGEKVPEKLAAEMKLAEELFKAKEFKKAKKSFEKAADLAAQIQEDEIVSFLKNKGEQVGTYPDLLKERETITREMKKVFIDLSGAELFKNTYEKIMPSVEKIVSISNNLEDEKAVEIFNELRKNAREASELAKKLYLLDKTIKRLLLKF